MLTYEQSPTVSTTDSSPLIGYRSGPMDKVIVLVTTDAENLQVVDITGAMTAAFIRERIFTKVRVLLAVYNDAR